MQKLTIKTPDMAKIKAQLKEFANKIKDFFKKLPDNIKIWFKNMKKTPIPIQIAWSSIILGMILIFTALIMMI